MKNMQKSGEERECGVSGEQNEINLLGAFGLRNWAREWPEMEQEAR